MTILQWVNTIIAVVGVPAVVGVLVYVGRKLQVLDVMETSHEKMRHNLKVISDYLTRHHAVFDPRELRALSPLQLTDDGEHFVEDIGFKNVFAKNESDFFAFIEGEEPKVKYDVETAAMKSIYALQDKPYMDFLKVFLYNNPERTLENMAPTLGVYIRDQYLAAHPEITQ